MSPNPPSSQSFSEMVSDQALTMTIKLDEIRKQEIEKPVVKSNRFLRRCDQKTKLAFAGIFEEYKSSLAEIRKDLGEDNLPANAETSDDFVYKFYNHQWKTYCSKWNSKRGMPKIDPELFTKEANKYLNELRTV